MLDHPQSDEIQMRALAVADTSSATSHGSGFSAEILSFPPRLRSNVGNQSEPSIQYLPNQAFALGHTPLSAQLALNELQQLHLASSWLADALVEIGELPLAARESGFVVPPEKSMESARRIARTCSHFGLSEPAFEVRESGEIEIFCREGARGLLILIHPNEIFQVFGEFDGDQWRARYNLAGPTWNRHVRKFLQEIAER
jgi:hypothetical protein